MARDSNLWLIGAALLGAGGYLLVRKSQDAAVAGATGATLFQLQFDGQVYAADIAAGAAGTMPFDFIDPAGGDAATRWALDVAAVGEYESGYGTDRGYSPAGDPTGWGDAGNAFGFWQLDKHYHNDFITSTDAQDPTTTVSAQAGYAASLLASNYKSFNFVVDPAAREQLMFITYNASLSRVKNMIAGGAPVAQVDATTTQRGGQGYGANVVNLVNSWAGSALVA